MIGRLLELQQLAWKAFFDFRLNRNPVWLSAAGQAALEARYPHIGPLGGFLPLSTFEALRLQAPPRVPKYVESYQQLQPHRLIHPDSLSYHATMSEPLFVNRQIRDLHWPLAKAFHHRWRHEDQHHTPWADKSALPAHQP